MSMIQYDQYLRQLYDFLQPFSMIWQNEVMLLSDDEIDSFYNQNWLHYLSNISEKQLWKIDSGSYDLKDISEISFRDYLREIEQRSHNIPSLKELNFKKLPSWANNKVAGKKNHEIQVIGSYLESSNKSFHHAIDIGGGVGHLARILAHYYHINFTTIDANKHFQDLGIKRLMKYPPPNGAKEVLFKNLTLDQHRPNQEVLSLFQKHDLSIGLHTCGPLSLAHFTYALKNHHADFLNFGCCYYKMSPKLHTNISDVSKKYPLPLNSYALTLATRGHNGQEWSQFLFKKRVKFYRYALHLFLSEKLNLKKVYTIGESKPKIYWGSFSDFAQLKIKSLQLTTGEISSRKLDEFYQSKKVQNKINTMFLCNIIRWRLGRLLELYILTDRALYLNQYERNVKLISFFDEKISPRNIGISTF